MGKLTSTLVLALTLTGCCCPPTGASSGDRNSGRDSSSVTFAFLGGLRAFFGSDSNEEKRAPDTGVVAKPKAEETDHAAALTIR